MSNSRVKIAERTVRLPETGTLQLSEREAQAIMEFVNSQAFKVLSDKVVPQVKNDIGRRSLQNSLGDTGTIYYRGWYEGVESLLKDLVSIREAYKKTHN
jgi:hypothetical protein